MYRCGCYNSMAAADEYAPAYRRRSSSRRRKTPRPFLGQELGAQEYEWPWQRMPGQESGAAEDNMPNREQDNFENHTEGPFDNHSERDFGPFSDSEFSNPANQNEDLELRNIWNHEDDFADQAEGGDARHFRYDEGDSSDRADGRDTRHFRYGEEELRSGEGNFLIRSENCIGNNIRNEVENQMSQPNYRPEPPRRQVALNSNSGSVGPLPIINTLLAAPISVVSTNIDTRGMGSTNNLLNFTSAINLPLGISVTLNFQIQRVAENGAPISVGSTYTFSTTVVVLEGEAFGFQFMDYSVPEGFYTYSVNISTNSLIDITPGLTINNAVLSVLAVGV